MHNFICYERPSDATLFSPEVDALTAATPGYIGPKLIQQ